MMENVEVSDIWVSKSDVKELVHVTDIGVHSESGEQLVIYQAVDKVTKVQSLKLFGYRYELFFRK